MTFPCEVKTTFDSSDSLNTHIKRRLNAALHPYVRHIDRVEVRLTDVNGPRVGPRDKVTVVDVRMRRKGSVVATGSASDLYLSVSRAASRVRSAVSRQVDRIVGRSRRTAGTRP